MSGLEAAGVILGALPLLIDGYDRVIAPFKAYQKFSSKFKAFHDGFEVQRTIFRTECILLLAPVTTRALAVTMLNDTLHPSWGDENLSERFNAQLGSLGSACKTTIQMIDRKLQEIEQKSKEFEGIVFPSTSQQTLSGKDWRRAVGKKFKFSFRSDNILRKSLEELMKLNDTFRILSCQVVRLETEWPLSSQDSRLDTKMAASLNRFRVIRDASEHLYESLCKACNTDHEHLARFSLDVEKRFPATGCGSVRFCLSYMILSERSKISTPAVISDQSRTGGQTSSVNTSTQSQGNGQRMKSGVWLDIESVRQPPVSDHSTGISLSHNLPGTSLPSSAVTTSKPVILGRGENLCTELTISSLDPSSVPTAPAQNSTIALWNVGTFQHFLHRSPSTDPDAIPLSRRLSQLPKRGHDMNLPEYQRLSLAKVLSGAVLQLQGTPWLSESLLSHNILVLELARETQFRPSSYGDQHFSLFIDVPLRLDTFGMRGDLDVSGTAMISSRSQFSSRLPSVAPNDFLYHLGILLLELAYHTSFDNLVAEVRQDDAIPLPLSADDRTAEFQIACRLADNVGTSMGSSYARIAKKCIRCDFGCGETLEDVALQRRVYQDVFCTLESLETGFKNLQTAVPAIP
ncbi:uncharacterized protein Z518_07096 [Rhinocladiella mackenziei CBS 650.93]|uniref:DUF7580 domain-containing protein n=1 Tax=Rhinocladiella mackenziei CBS 650.93 TaxID=1442369 RepID=A0A0D2GZF8_9EURO|nr:uncharacterized protein Z518_07096 [Rhinocladiella mackenziei CBS 650.93]KIX03543.1 hypothetical protein Z518_07096 [Rhinocladiella mackenziei CBS 650.93]